MMSIQNHTIHQVASHAVPSIASSVSAEVIRMMNKPTHVRCVNTPNGSMSDASTSSACKLISDGRVSFAIVFLVVLVNLDRGRGELENDIRKLLNDIRDRRTRLVHENSQPTTFLPASIDAPAAVS